MENQIIIGLVVAAFVAVVIYFVVKMVGSKEENSITDTTGNDVTIVSDFDEIQSPEEQPVEELPSEKPEAQKVHVDLSDLK